MTKAHLQNEGELKTQFKEELIHSNESVELHTYNL